MQKILYRCTSTFSAVLNLLSASVAKNQHFRPCKKNYALDRKMIALFTIVTTLSISMQSLVEIELRAPAVGAKICDFCMSRLVCLCVGDTVQTSIVWRFMGRF